MTSVSKPFLCVWCQHLHRDVEEFQCDAFPDGIPGQILQDEADHRHTYPGDNGVQFVKDPAIEDEPPFDEMFEKSASADNSESADSGGAEP